MTREARLVPVTWGKRDVGEWAEAEKHRVGPSGRSVMLAQEPLCAVFVILGGAGSCCGVQSSLVVVHELSSGGTRLSCPVACGIFALTRDRTHVPCIKRRVLNPLDHQGSPSCALSGRKGVGIVQAFRTMSRGGDGSLGGPSTHTYGRSSRKSRGLQRLMAVGLKGRHPGRGFEKDLRGFSQGGALDTGEEGKILPPNPEGFVLLIPFYKREN